MSLNLNWHRLDETVATAFMSLLNKKLAAVFHLGNGDETVAAAVNESESGKQQQQEFHTPRSPVTSDDDDGGGGVVRKGNNAAPDKRGTPFGKDGRRASVAAASFSSPPAMGAPVDTANISGKGGSRTKSTRSQATTEQKKKNSFRVEKFEVTSLVWGDAPPFIEILSITDAIDFGMPAATPLSAAPASYQHHRPPHTSSSTNVVAGAAADRSPQRVSSSSDLPSNSSFSSLHVVNTPTAGGNTFPGSFAPHHHHQVPPRVPPLAFPNTLQSSSSAGAVGVDDTLAKLFGKDGLLVRLHVTYGGQLSLASSCSVRNQINLAENFFIAVSLPMQFFVSQIHLNCYVNINLHRNACRVWLDPTPGSDSPFQKVSIRAELGASDSSGDCSLTANMSDLASPNGSGGGGADVPLTVDVAAGVASGKRGRPVSHNNSSSSNVCVDERAITQLVLTELRAVLSQKLVAPHFVEFPLTI